MAKQHVKPSPTFWPSTPSAEVESPPHWLIVGSNRRTKLKLDTEHRRSLEASAKAERDLVQRLGAVQLDTHPREQVSVGHRDGRHGVEYPEHRRQFY